MEAFWISIGVLITITVILSYKTIAEDRKLDKEIEEIIKDINSHSK